MHKLCIQARCLLLVARELIVGTSANRLKYCLPSANSCLAFSLFSLTNFALCYLQQQANELATMQKTTKLVASSVLGLTYHERFLHTTAATIDTAVDKPTMNIACKGWRSS